MSNKCFVKYTVMWNWKDPKRQAQWYQAYMDSFEKQAAVKPETDLANNDDWEDAEPVLVDSLDTATKYCNWLNERSDLHKWDYLYKVFRTHYKEVLSS